jgi:hypothetical protein
MMRHIVRSLARSVRLAPGALALVSSFVLPLAAQMPPVIRKPIDAAKRQANRTSDQISNEQKTGNDQSSKAAAMPAPAAQTAAQSAAQKGAPSKQAAPVATAAPAADSVQKRGSVTQSGTKGSVTFYREVFSYEGEGRRDPFLSLMATGELRPMVSDLTLVGIIYDESGRNSVAILVDASAGGQTYRRRVGDSLGRMKVIRITEKDITFNIYEFGSARQETLLIDRNPRTGARRPQ